ncbi:MAG: OmpH family outer membrane protein [Deltaproteobacteria bacterium]|nr:OmpH family outer membrane protein [Deltaproteobacteria bacterium]
MRLLKFAVPLFITTVMSASSTHAANDNSFKIGYVNLARALNEVEDGKTAKAKLKTDFDKKQKKLDKMQNDLKVKKEDFDKKAAMMNPEVKAKKQEELQRSFVELQRTYMELQKELSEQESKLTTEIAQKIQRVIDTIGDRDGYHVILNIGDTVLYYKRHLDLTDTVVREYNRKFSSKK